MSYERLKMYFQTSAQETCTILGLSQLKKRLKNQGNHNNVFYVVFYELSDDQVISQTRRLLRRSLRLPRRNYVQL